MEKESERTERTDLVTLTAPEGQQYTNADRSMVGKTITCLKGYEDTLTLITDEEAETIKEGQEGQEGEE